MVILLVMLRRFRVPGQALILLAIVLLVIRPVALFALPTDIHSFRDVVTPDGECHLISDCAPPSITSVIPGPLPEAALLVFAAGIAFMLPVGLGFARRTGNTLVPHPPPIPKCA